MRTLIFLFGGLVFLGVCLGVARLLFSNAAGSMRLAILIFLAAWLTIAAVNLWVGVTRAGYSFSEELPIFLLLFGLPAAVALFVKWRYS